ncbi:hypothetical protein K6U06_06665 [Acidiferrimicrobium sp. IK]|uniref:hypothetical protein n=1 Tax=Acidiferrimicrobium sp. IK TaxID=2871700 RepID=UPI0021CB1AC5|nr:hypothetical protein [Acidiferrimicrobium sp. IK]MCU4184036.1 hypothetical protein [Acidiferrimicrobium sp. IK]
MTVFSRPLLRRADPQYPFPGLYGWLATATVVVGFDLWAARTRRPTMSRTLGHYLSQPILGPVLAGSWAGLAYHLLVEERLVALDRALINARSVAEITTPPSEVQ